MFSCPTCRKKLVPKKTRTSRFLFCEYGHGFYKTFQNVSKVMGPKVASFLMTSKEIEVRKVERGCPVCKKQMGVIVCPTSKKTEIDRCPSCRGFWFDDND